MKKLKSLLVFIIISISSSAISVTFVDINTLSMIRTISFDFLSFIERSRPAAAQIPIDETEIDTEFISDMEISPPLQSFKKPLIIYTPEFQQLRLVRVNLSEIGQQIKNHRTELTDLVIEDFPIEAYEIQILINSISLIPNLQKLTLKKCNLRSKTIDKLAQIMNGHEFSLVKELDISENQGLDKKDIVKLAQFFSHVEVIDISQTSVKYANNIYEDEIEFIKYKFPSLKEILIDEDRINFLEEDESDFENEDKKQRVK